MRGSFIKYQFSIKSKEELRDLSHEELLKYIENLQDNIKQEKHVKGYCTTIEQILNAYGGVSAEEMMEIKRPIIGEISLRRGKNKNMDIDYDVPTFFRKQHKER